MVPQWISTLDWYGFYLQATFINLFNDGLFYPLVVEFRFWLTYDQKISKITFVISVGSADDLRTGSSGMNRSQAKRPDISF